MPLTKKQRQKRFQKVKQLAKAGLSVQEIVKSNLVDLSYTTIKSYLNFETYQEYLDAQKERLAKYRKNSKKTKTQSLDKTKKVDPWFENVLESLQEIEAFLESIDNKLDDKLKVKIF